MCIRDRLTGEQESTLKEAREKAAAARDGDLAKVTKEEKTANSCRWRRSGHRIPLRRIHPAILG